MADYFVGAGGNAATNSAPAAAAPVAAPVGDAPMEDEIMVSGLMRRTLYNGF